MSPLPATKGRRTMIRKYEIYSGCRVVSTQYSVSPTQAVLDYVRSYGVKDDEIRRLGVDSVSWRALTSAPCSFLQNPSSLSRTRGASRSSIRR
jgi:hypothetical protein